MEISVSILSPEVLNSIERVTRVVNCLISISARAEQVIREGNNCNRMVNRTGEQ